jgi:diguanylate cyclase (GGDEF)-like protein
MIDVLLPFGMLLNADGAVLHYGRSLRKLMDPGVDPSTVFEALEIRKPRAVRSTGEMVEIADKRLTLMIKNPVASQDVLLRGHATEFRVNGEVFYFLNISLSSETLNLVDELGLSSSDFSFADPSVDLLYLLKAQTTLLNDSMKLNERLKRARDDAEILAKSDALTGLPNRRAFADYMQTLLSCINQDSDSKPAAVFHIDLDHFKRVNDTLGHAAGDAVLVRVASILREFASERDLIARIGGDEFVYVSHAVTDPGDLVQFGDQIIHAISAPFSINENRVNIGASIGICLHNHGDRIDIDGLLLKADIALYEVKRTGRRAASVYNETLDSRKNRIDRLTKDFERGLESDQFVPFYQLQIDTQTNKIFGAEVLARWNHPEFGVLEPFDFLFVAKRANLTDKMDEKIRQKALRNYKSWRDNGIAPSHISFNITQSVLKNKAFFESFVYDILQNGLRTSEVVLELLESVMFDDNAEELIEIVHQLSNHGFQFSLDDFGTGHTSISSLINLPVRYAKIDRSFVRKLDFDKKCWLVTKSILQLCNELGITAIAEGVETEGEIKPLKALGCTHFQGFHYGHPLAPEEFEALLYAQKHAPGEARFRGV